MAMPMALAGTTTNSLSMHAQPLTGCAYAYAAILKTVGWLDVW